MNSTKFTSLPILNASDASNLPRSQGATSRFPDHLRRKLPRSADLSTTKTTLQKTALPTVCEEAKCPNLPQCFAKKTATFLTLGPQCTRHCPFCSISHHKAPPLPDPLEGERIVEAADRLDLRHIVLTMVARDDLELGGSIELAKIVDTLVKKRAQMTIELLTSDFEGNEEAIVLLCKRPIAVFNHNIETVEALSSKARHKASYGRSIELITRLKTIQDRQKKQMKIKSGLMVGLGETTQQVESSLRDLQKAGCDIVTIGQYLRPTRKHLPVVEFITQEQFAHYRDYGQSIGIQHMYCGPFVRSSYNADLFV